MSLATFAQTYTDPYATTYITNSSNSSLGAPELFMILILLVFYFAVIVLMIVALWKVYVKTGRPGWASIVPVYNSWVLFEIVGYPGWWALLSLVPLVNIFPAVMMIVAYFKLAKLFGKSDGFAVCTIFFPMVTLPMLAFGSSTFQGSPAAIATDAPQAPQSPILVQQSAPQAPQAPEAPDAPQTPQGPLVQ